MLRQSSQESKCPCQSVRDFEELGHACGPASSLQSLTVSSLLEWHPQCRLVEPPGGNYVALRDVLCFRLSLSMTRKLRHLSTPRTTLRLQMQPGPNATVGGQKILHDPESTIIAQFPGSRYMVISHLRGTPIHTQKRENPSCRDPRKDP